MGDQPFQDFSISERSLVDTALATAAYLLYWSFLVTCLIFPVASQAAVGPTVTVLPASCGLAAFALMQIVHYRMPSLYAKLPTAALVGAVLALTAPLLAAMAASAFSLQAGLVLQAAAWFAWGIGQGLAFPLIGSVQSRADAHWKQRRITPFLVAGSFAGTSVPCALALFAPDPLRSFLPTLYFAAAMMTLAAGLHRLAPTCLPEYRVFRERFNPLSSPKIVSPFIIGATLSLTLCYCIARFGMQETLAMATVACLVGGCLMLIAIKAFDRPIINAAIERVYFPVTAACFFLASFIPPKFQVVPCCTAIAMFILYAIFHWSLLHTLARQIKTTSPHHFALGLLSPSLGLFAGWIIAAAYAMGNGGLERPAILLFGWVVAYIIVLSVAPYASDPLFEIDMLDPDEEPSEQGERQGTWKRACEDLAAQARLSPREREVFYLLAHGRNVENIKDKLYISANTAKTHKYRIFRKLGVSTHQEMLDLIEESAEAEQRI